MEEIESDLCFVSACILIGANVEALAERAGILEHDAGLPRDEANRAALVLEMKSRNKRYSKRFCRAFFDAAGPAMEAEKANGWTREQTMAELAARLAEGINARV